MFLVITLIWLMFTVIFLKEDSKMHQFEVILVPARILSSFSVANQCQNLQKYVYNEDQLHELMGSRRAQWEC